jgi:hypothetical protein
MTLIDRATMLAECVKRHSVELKVRASGETYLECPTVCPQRPLVSQTAGRLPDGLPTERTHHAHSPGLLMAIIVIELEGRNMAALLHHRRRRAA